MLATQIKEPPVDSRTRSGPAAAIVLSACLGAFVLGLATVLAQASTTIKQALNWWAPAGPLTGKAGVAVIAWLGCWLLFHMIWRDRDVPFKRVWIGSLVLLGLGFLFTFPPVFEAF